jgi:hypothetical protein
MIESNSDFIELKNAEVELKNAEVGFIGLAVRFEIT